MSHYFVDDPNLKDDFHEISFEILRHPFVMMSSSGVFSKNELDFGSRLLIEETIRMGLSGKVLDLGCGIGVIGLVLASFFPDAHFLLADINSRAVNIARINKERLLLRNVEVKRSDIFSDIDEKFDFIVTNPPIRAGKKVVYAMFEQSFEHLNNKGCLILVIRKAQGAPSAMVKLESIFPLCSIIKKKKGYYIIKCQKLTLYT